MGLPVLTTIVDSYIAFQVQSTVAGGATLTPDIEKTANNNGYARGFLIAGPCMFLAFIFCLFVPSDAATASPTTPAIRSAAATPKLKTEHAEAAVRPVEGQELHPIVTSNDPPVVAAAVDEPRVAEGTKSASL